MLEPDEVDGIVDNAEQAFNQYYAEQYGPLDRDYFTKTWKMLLFTGQGIIFVESQKGIDQGACGCVRGQNLYRNTIEYICSFLVVKPEYRGGTVVFRLLAGVHRLLERMGTPCHLFMHTRINKLQRAFDKLGYIENGRQYMRRIMP